MPFKEVYAFNEKGFYYCEGNAPRHDLFMASRKRTVWINPYADGTCDKYLYATEDDADNAQGYGRIGCRAWPLEIED